MTISTYYPKSYTPLHEVKDWAKVRRIIRARKAGVAIPAILVDGIIGNGNLLTGTHRCAANEIMEMLGYDDALMVPVDLLSDLPADKQERIVALISQDDYTEIQEIQEEV